MVLALAVVSANAAARSDETLWDALLKSGQPVSTRPQTAPTTPADVQPSRADETLWDALLRTSSRSDGPIVAIPEDPSGQPGAPAVGVRRKGFRLPFKILDTLQGWMQNLGKRTRSDIKINGQHNIRYHMESIGGSRASYDNASYYGRRGMGGYTDTDLTITGKVLGLLTFETRYSNSMYGMPYDNRLKLSYANKTFAVEAGHIQGGIMGNSLVDFSRSLQGISLTTNVAPGVKVSALYSEERAQTRTIVINGANRSGPYYVFAGQVVDGSARVRINNRELLLGQDYTLDPFTGELNFLNGMIVGELDTIAITFETYGYNQSPGMLTGWRADLTQWKPVRFGVTYLNQMANGGSANTRTKTEQFYGYNSATTPYVLDLPVEVTLIRDAEGKITGCTPVTPMTVTVSGLPQLYGTDYVLDPLLPNRVYFKMAIPSTQIIKIVYTPARSDQSSGDRSIIALDATGSLGKIGTITAEMARSSLSLSGNGASASAWQIRSDMKFARDRLKLNWTLKNIGSNFTAVQSPGFRRNDRGLSLNADYQPAAGVKLTATMEKMRRPAYSYLSGSSGGLADSVGMDDYNQFSLRALWQIGKTGTLSLNHNDMRTRLGSGGRSTHTTETLAYQQSLGQFSIDASLARQSAMTSAVFNLGSGSTTQPSTYGSNSVNARLAAKWRLGERLSFDAMVTNSIIKSVGGKSNTAQDVTFNIRSLPMKNMTLNLGYSYQTSGGYSIFNGYTDYSGASGQTGTLATRQTGGTGGYYGGTGQPIGGIGGYYGGGVNGGLGGYGNYSGGLGGGLYGMGSASFGGNSRGLNVAINYQPWPTLSLDLTYMSGASIGDYLFNSKRSGLAFSANYNPGERLSLVGGAMLQDVSYVGSTGGTNTATFYLNAQARPLGKLITSFNANFMRSNTRTASSQTPPTTGLPGGGYYGGGYGGYFGSGSANLTSYGLRLEYPVWIASNLYYQWDTADSTGYLASTQSTMSLGLAFDLGNNTVFQIGLRDQRYTARGSATSGDYSYHVRSLDADLGLRF